MLDTEDVLIPDKKKEETFASQNFVQWPLKAFKWLSRPSATVPHVPFWFLRHGISLFVFIFPHSIKKLVRSLMFLQCYF